MPATHTVGTQSATLTLNRTAFNGDSGITGAEEVFTAPISGKFASSYQIEWTGDIAADAIDVQVSQHPLSLTNPNDSKVVWSTKPEVVPDELPTAVAGNTAQAFQNMNFVAWRLRINVTAGEGDLVVRMM